MTLALIRMKYIEPEKLLPKLPIYLLQVPLTMGLYSVYVEEWLRVFPRKQLYFLKFEEFIHNRQKYLQQIFRFLGLGK